MPHPNDMTAEQILSVSVTRPENLFGGSPLVEDIYRQLAKLWHPDVNWQPQAKEVFQHIATVHAEAKRQLELGVYGDGCQIMEMDSYRLPVRKLMTTAYGLVGINDARVIDAVHSDLSSKLTGFELLKDEKSLFKNVEVRNQVKPLLPAIPPDINKSKSRGDYAYFYTTSSKSYNCMRLLDVLDHLGGLIDPRSAAWMISGAFNLACYLQVHDLVHNAIDLTNLWITPDTHQVALLTGWCFAAKKGDEIHLVPDETKHVASPGKRASTVTDLLCVRAVARKLLKPSNGGPLIAFLDSPCTGDAIDEYRRWHQALEAAFGARKFIAMKVDPHKVY